MATRPIRYTPRPTVPATEAARTRVLLSVLQGQRTVSAAARELGLSRVQVQTLLHRGLTGFIDALVRKPAGRPRRPESEAALRAENARLKREAARWQRRAQTTDRLLEVASGLLKGRVPMRGRTPRTTASRCRSPRHEGPDDPDGDEQEQRLTAAQRLHALGLPAPRAAAVVGVGEATVRRWAARRRTGQPLAQRRGPRGSPVTPDTMETAATLVRELRGLVGAETLRRSVPGLSRRQAAAIKRQTLTRLERERRATAARITVTTPGVLRSFDAMQVRTRRGRRHLLIASDGAVPYRTSCVTTTRYTGRAVARVLAEDFARHGAPLVCRLDRAHQHRTVAVRAVLRRHHVLVLHGPPRCPRFYGQLERQNREHRQWLNRQETPTPAALPGLGARLRTLCNSRWRRRILGWHTAEEAWTQRSPLTVDRVAFGHEVQHRAARLRRHLAERGHPADLPERMAIEQALIARGYLRRVSGGWC